MDKEETLRAVKGKVMGWDTEVLFTSFSLFSYCIWISNLCIHSAIHYE